MEERSAIREGMTVYSADGERLGRVVSCYPTTFVIEKGFFFRKDYVARYEDVSRLGGYEARLRVNKRDVPERDAASSGELPTDAPRADEGVRTSAAEADADADATVDTATAATAADDNRGQSVVRADQDQPPARNSAEEHEPAHRGHAARRKKTKAR